MALRILLLIAFVVFLAYSQSTDCNGGNGKVGLLELIGIISIEGNGARNAVLFINKVGRGSAIIIQIQLAADIYCGQIPSANECIGGKAGAIAIVVTTGCQQHHTR